MSLGDLPGGEISSSARAVSADGSTVVGSSSGGDWVQPFRWTAETGMMPLGVLPGATSPRGRAWDVSGDGSAVVGQIQSPHGMWEAFRWTTTDGLLGLGDFPGGKFDSVAYGISADGNTIVGSGLAASGGYGRRAFIWDLQHGMRDLSELLDNEYGLDLQGVTLHAATATSANGRVIVGWGTKAIGDGIGSVAWRVDLGPIPEPSAICLALLSAPCVLVSRRKRT
jgi:uncharacterized membrane protein